MHKFFLHLFIFRVKISTFNLARFLIVVEPKQDPRFIVPVQFDRCLDLTWISAREMKLIAIRPQIIT